MFFVFDACAIIAFLRGEPGTDILESVIQNPDHVCLVHAINLCEVYYEFLRTADEAAAKSAVRDTQEMGVMTREDMDAFLWQDAGRYKATGKISLADCFAIALTKKVGATLMTSDHHEFDPIAARGICPIRFFR